MTINRSVDNTSLNRGEVLDVLLGRSLLKDEKEQEIEEYLGTSVLDVSISVSK